MDRCVLLFIVGTKYAARTLVAVSSLRKWWGGPIVILNGDNQPWLVGNFDGKNGVRVIQCPMAKQGRNAAYLTKTTLWRFTPHLNNIFLDADTMTTGPLDRLWPIASEIVLTRFSEWVTTGNMMSGRIKRWEKIRPALVAEALSKPKPAINTGVFAFRRDIAFLGCWEELTRLNPIFMCDEIAAQILYEPFAHRLLDDRFNCSPKFGVNRQHVCVWHYHGEAHVKTTHQPWFDQLLECWEQNDFNCNAWMRPLLIQQEKDAMAKIGLEL